MISTRASSAIVHALFWVFFASFDALAVDSYCAVVEGPPDGFLNLRAGPASTFDVIARLRPSDQLDVSSDICREQLCDETHTWQFVEGVPRLDQEKKLQTQGWVHSKYITQVPCPGQSESYDGPFSAIAAAKDAWEIVGRHKSIEEARDAAIQACTNYTDDDSPCPAVTAGLNQHYFVAAVCGGVPFTSKSTRNCYDAIGRVRREARRRGYSQCKIFRCEQGGGPWKYGRY